MADITVANTGERYTCPPDTLLLDAALDAGLAMPHSCRGGACGTCKAQVLEGAVDHGWALSFAITDEEKAAGYCLCCQSKPASETVTLRMVNEMHAASGPAIVPAAFEAEVVASEAVSTSVRRLVIQPPAGMRFVFHAGQNLEFTVPELAAPRPYSIANAPMGDGTARDGMLEFFIARYDEGRASVWLHARQVGDRVAVKGPYGSFTLPEGEGPILACAGGTGLAPILSVVTAALEQGFAAPVRLLVSVRDRREVFAYDRLAALARRHSNLGVIWCLTRETPAEGPWRAGRIPAILAADQPDLSAARVLIAGAPAFVEAVSAACLARGASRIAVDSFLPRSA